MIYVLITPDPKVLRLVIEDKFSQSPYFEHDNVFFIKSHKEIKELTKCMKLEELNLVCIITQFEYWGGYVPIDLVEKIKVLEETCY